MYSTEISGHVHAPREMVYQALLDPEAVAKWRAPHGMTGHVHEFDAREGGRFRVSLTYDAPDQEGKSSEHTDTYHGHFETLVPGEQVVEIIEFETTDPALQGAMTMTTTLTDDGKCTLVHMRHDGMPDSVPPADNETGSRMSLEKLADYVQSRKKHG